MTPTDYPHQCRIGSFRPPLEPRLDHYETTRLTKGRGLVHVSITVSPIRDFQGRIIGASKIARAT